MSEGQYSDMILVDCNRLSSEQSKGNTDNDGKSVWTNKLGSGIKLNQGDKVSIHSGFVSERGAGDSSMEFEGITQKQQYYLRAPTLKKFQYMNNPRDTRGTAYDRLNTDANGTPGKASCHYYEMEQQGPFDIKDNEINFKISYYKTTNGQGYFHLPRRFDAWKQNFNENSMSVINSTFSAGDPANPYDPNDAILYNSEYYRNNNTHLFGQNADINTAAIDEKRGSWTDPFRPFTTAGSTHDPKLTPQVFSLSVPNLALEDPTGAAPTATTKGLNGWVNSPNMYMLSALQKVGTAGGTPEEKNTIFKTFPQPMDDNWANGRTMNLWDDAILNSLKPCKADLFWYNGYGQTSMSQLTLSERPQDVVDDSGDYFNSVETAGHTPSTTGTAGPNASYRAAGWKGKNDNSKYTIFVKEISYFSQPSQVYDFNDIGPCGFSPNIKRIGNTDYGDSKSVDNNTTSRHDYFPYTDGNNIQLVDGAPLAIRDPAVSEYIRYEEIKNLTVPEGYNTATNIADELTTQLNKTKTPEIIYGQVGGTFADSKFAEFRDISGWYNTFLKANGDSNAPPKPISKPVSIKRESETYKSFPCATSITFNSEHHSRFFMGHFGLGTSSKCNEGAPSSDNPVYAAKNTNYLSSYATIGVKRPDLWEAGREITKNCGRRIISNGNQTADYVASQNGTSGWSWKQVIYPQIVSQIYPTGGGGAGDFTQLTAVVETDIEWNENNLKLIKKFLDIQGKYPELWDGVEYEVNMTSPNSIATQGLSPDNSRYIHVNGWDHEASTDGIDNWKYQLGSDNYGESYIGGTTGGGGDNNSESFLIGKGTSGTTEIRTHASMPLWFYYDKSRTDIADGGTSENDLYYGFAKKITYRDQYENESGSQVEQANGNYAAGLTTFNISSLGGIYKPDSLYTGEFISATIVGEEGSGWTTPINITNSVFVAGGQTLTIASGLPIDLVFETTKLTVNFVRFKTREGIAFTTKKIGGLADYYFKSNQNGASGFGTGRRRTVGFDPHFSAYGSSAICLYSGLLSGQPSNDNFQDGRNSKLDKATSHINMSYRYKDNYLYQNPYVLEQPSRMRGDRTLPPTTLNNGGTPAGSYVPPSEAPEMPNYATNNGIYKNKSPIYQYIRERYVGATNPQLSFDTASSRFNFQSLHTPERVGGSGSLGATTSAWDIYQAGSGAGDSSKDELITLDQTSVPADINNDVYYVNKRFTNRNDFCPDLFPYEQPILCAYYNEQANMVVAATENRPEDTANLVKQTYTPLNGAVSPFSIMDADGGIFIEDFGLSWDGNILATDTDKRNYQKKNWDKSLWSVLGFTWEQFHSQTTLSRQNRINSISTNTSLGALTTNAEVSQADLSKFSSNLFGVPYNTSQLPITQNPMIEESSLVVNATTDAQSKSYQFTTTAPTDYYPVVNQSSKSVEISAVNLPRKMINPYYLVKSDIVSDLKYYGGDDSGISLPIVYVVNKENGFGDFFFQSQGQQEFTITKATTLSSITTSIHLPNMRTPLLNEGSSIIYKIVKQNQAQLGVAEQILEQEMKKQKSKKK